MRIRIHYILVVLIAFALGLGVLTFLSLSPSAKTAPHMLKELTPSPSISVTVIVVSDTSKPLLPDAFSLSQNYPNPFNPETQIEYTLPENCHVELTIYNILGQKVKTLVNQYQNAGYKRVHWNSRDDEGKEVASGIYFYKFEVDKYVYIKKMMVIK